MGAFRFYMPAIFWLTIVGLILLVTFVVSRTQSSGAPPANRETPLQILDRRFAAGEITAEDYQKARDLLKAGPKT